MASMQRSALSGSLASRWSGAPLVAPVSSRRSMKPCAAIAKDFIEEISTIPGSLRFVVRTSGGIMEAVAAAGAPKFTEIPEKGTLATFSNDDKSFEAHIYLSKLSEAKVAKEQDSYSIQLVGAESTTLLTLMLNGSVPDAAAIKAWQALRAKHGDIVFFENDEFGDAMFSFSDA